jgi:hypothetical protein
MWWPSMTSPRLRHVRICLLTAVCVAHLGAALIRRVARGISTGAAFVILGFLAFTAIGTVHRIKRPDT